MKENGQKFKCQHCPKVFDRPGLRRVHEQVESSNITIKYPLTRPCQPCKYTIEANISSYIIYIWYIPSFTQSHSNVTNATPPSEGSPISSGIRGPPSIFNCSVKFIYVETQDPPWRTTFHMWPLWSRLSNPVKSSDPQEAKSSWGKQTMVLWLLWA